MSITPYALRALLAPVLVVASTLAIGSLQAATATVNPGDSIQVALDAVGNAGGGTVYVNSGNYANYSPCTIPNSTSLKGSGSTRPVLTMAGAKNQEVVRNKSVPFSSVTADFISVNAGLTNAQMDAATYNASNGINLGDHNTASQSSNGTIINCYATNCSQGYMMGFTTTAKLDSCTVTNCGGGEVGTTPGLHNIYISSCDPFLARYVTSTNCRTGIGLKMCDWYSSIAETSQVVEYCTLTGNKGISGKYNGIGLAVYNINNLIVRNSSCSNNTGDGMYIVNCTSGGQLLNNTCTGNSYVTNVAYDIFLSGCANMTISGNTYNTKSGF